MENFSELDLPEKQWLIIRDIKLLNKRINVYEKINKPLLWFILSFIAFHIILMLLWGEHGVYWQLYTGIMLIAGISYVFIKEILPPNDY